ncbi:MAG: FtsX-like permease family protein [Calditrichaeota bacterium]|nr:MAG: FtsX-like permease family protein [Calditrichota bacterium]
MRTFLEYLRNAWDSLNAHRVRSFFTILGIVIGVTTIICIFTIIQSINRYVEGEFSGLGASTVYVSKYPWVITGNWWEFRNRPPITLREYRALREQSVFARWISPLIESFRTVQYRSHSLEQVYTVGCNEEYPETANVSVSLGRWFTHLEVEHARPVVVIGAHVQEVLFGLENPLGKRIKINGLPYKVVGVLEKRGNFFGFNMDNQIIIPYTTFRTFRLSRRNIAIALRVSDPNQLDELKDEIRGILRRVRKIPPTEKDNFSINQQDMLTQFYHQLTGTLYLVVFVVGGISLIVGGIGIANIMLVSVTERTREIGIRKAVGATRTQIIVHFLSESILISLVGGFLGIVAGVLVSQIPLNLMKLGASVSPGTVLIGVGFSSLVGILSGLYPANRAARVNPIEALRYE